MKLTIYRDKWLRGGNGVSMLRNSYGGSMCCMGFLARACGIDSPDIVGRNYFRYLHPSIAEKLPDALRPQQGEETLLARKIYNENDYIYDATYRPAHKEERLTELMKEAGIELVFEDHTPTETLSFVD